MRKQVMRIGLYQFAGSSRISDNMAHICRAVKGAAAQSVRLLVFHECALCGYPPLETAVDDIHAEYWTSVDLKQSIAERETIREYVGY